jgi:dTDP-4-amino-4,6-dideoxygalactose transaminase
MTFGNSAAATPAERDTGLATPPLDMRSKWPVHGDDEIEAVVGILKSGRVNSLHHGDYCTAFETEFAAYCNMPHGIAVANGTLALELGLRALGIGAGDEVIIPARSFFASASCVVACGATPVFADIDPVSQNISPAGIQSVLSTRTRDPLRPSGGLALRHGCHFGDLPHPQPQTD